MIAIESEPSIRSRRGEPAWNLALLYPAQGEWSEAEYLALGTNRLVEFSDGCIEVLPMPSWIHQMIVKYLLRALDDFVESGNLGSVLVAPYPIRILPGKLREPDVLFLKPNRVASKRRPPSGADLVIEVVSEGSENRERDLVTKRDEYAAAAIPEYWIVDPEMRTITVLTLSENATVYSVHGEFRIGDRATSKLLEGFAVDVNVVFREEMDKLNGA